MTLTLELELFQDKLMELVMNHLISLKESILSVGSIVTFTSTRMPMNFSIQVKENISTSTNLSNKGMSPKFRNVYYLIRLHSTGRKEDSVNLWIKMDGCLLLCRLWGLKEQMTLEICQIGIGKKELIH